MPCTCGKVGRPTFGVVGGKPMWCKSCKTDDMTDIKNPKCGCPKGVQPGYGFPTDLRATCCKDCKVDGMEDMHHMKCGCPRQTRPSFGYPLDERPTCCKDCKVDGMEDIISIRCGCPKRVHACFGHATDVRATCCKDCKIDAMIDIVHPRCGCPLNVRPSFGFSTDERPSRCHHCKLDGMEPMDGRKCKCPRRVRPHFGYPTDETPTCCFICQKDGMVDLINRICPGPGCLGNRTIGLQSNRKYDGYCMRCFIELFPSDPRTATARKNSFELLVKDMLMKEFPGLFVHDTTLWTGGCDCTHRRRIDFRTLVGLTLICCECDEFEHKYRDQHDEEVRYDDLYMIHSGKFIFIRFNPHPLTIKGVKHDPLISERLTVLRDTIVQQLQRATTNEWPTSSDLIDVIPLYYSSN